MFMMIWGNREKEKRFPSPGYSSWHLLAWVGYLHIHSDFCACICFIYYRIESDAWLGSDGTPSTSAADMPVAQSGSSSTNFLASYSSSNLKPAQKSVLNPAVAEFVLPCMMPSPAADRLAGPCCDNKDLQNTDSEQELMSTPDECKVLPPSQSSLASRHCLIPFILTANIHISLAYVDK